MDSVVASFRKLNATGGEDSGTEQHAQLDIAGVTDLATRLAQALARCSQALSQQAGTHPRPSERLTAEVSRACEAVATLINANSSWKSSATNAIWTLISQHDQSQERLLKYFESDIKTIITSVLDQDENRGHEHAFRTILELCHREAHSQQGDLHSQTYLDELEESTLETPFDPDFDSEKYYEHEERLQIDEDYAQSEYMRQEESYERQMRAREETQHSWVDFWLRKLEACYQGPTFFRLLTAIDRDAPHLFILPDYLIRVSDLKSSGRTDEQVVASAASKPGHHQVDLCRIPQKEAAERLGAHLNKTLGDDGNQGKNNLMSWSSSLLFAIQYAIYRCNNLGSLPHNVKFCVIDLRKFPYGQFARDIWLIEEYYEHDVALEDLRRLRQGSDYDNGEYLSQGTVSHEGRSCSFSLQDAIDAGLYSLYPEFDDPEGRKKWTNRVRQLRETWSYPQPTTRAEIQATLKIVRQCFKGFDPLEISFLLLSLKNRAQKSSMRKAKELANAGPKRLGVQHKPSEVQRYLECCIADKQQRSYSATDPCLESFLQREYGCTSG